MKSLLWKELRQLAPWGALILAAMSSITLGSLFSEWHRYDISHLWFHVWVVIVFGAPCVAFVTGALQTVLEVRRDQWAFLIQRGLSPTQIFLAKAGAGLSIYAVVAIFPAFIGLTWCAWHGVDRHTLSWYHALPLLASGLSATAFYFAAVLAVVWKGPWYFSRLLPLVTPVLMSIGVVAYTSEVTEFVSIQVFLAIAVAVIVQGVAAWGVFVKSGEAPGRSRTANVCLAVPIFVALFGGCLCLFAAAVPAYEWLASHCVVFNKVWLPGPFTYFTVNRDGHVLQVVSRQIHDGRNMGLQFVSITDLDEPQSNRYASLIGQNLNNADKLSGWNPLPMATVRFGGYSPFFGRLNSAETPGHIIEQIGRSGDLNWSETFFSPDGLIFVYRENRTIQEDGRTMMLPPTLESVVGPDGFSNAVEIPVRRFGNLLANSRDPWSQNTQFVWQDLFKLSGNTNRYCLLFDDGLYLIDPPQRNVRPLLVPGEGRKIRCLTRLGASIAVVYDDSISVHSATPVVIGTRNNSAAPDAVEETVDVPGEFQYSFPLPRELARFEEFSFGRLPDRDVIVFAHRSGVSTFDLHQFIEMRLDGTIVRRRDLRASNLPPEVAIPSLTGVAAFAPSGPVVALIAANEIQQVAVGDAPGTCFRLFRALPLGMLIPTAVLLGSSLFCGWSAGRTARRYGFDRRTRRVWQWTAVLLGPAALLTLWFLRDWPAFEKCSACSNRRPIDRDLCPRCGARAMPPAVNETEIIIGEPALAS